MKVGWYGWVGRGGTLAPHPSTPRSGPSLAYCVVFYPIAASSVNSPPSDNVSIVFVTDQPLHPVTPNEP